MKNATFEIKGRHESSPSQAFQSVICRAFCGLPSMYLPRGISVRISESRHVQHTTRDQTKGPFPRNHTTPCNLRHSDVRLQFIRDCATIVWCLAHGISGEMTRKEGFKMSDENIDEAVMRLPQQTLELRNHSGDKWRLVLALLQSGWLGCQSFEASMALGGCRRLPLQGYRPQ
jgi:hypothetical protein